MSEDVMKKQRKAMKKLSTFKKARKLCEKDKIVSIGGKDFVLDVGLKAQK